MFARLKGKGKEPPRATLSCDIDKDKIYSAGSVIRGVVHLEIDPKKDFEGRDRLVELAVTFKIGQHSTYEGLPMGGGSRAMIDSRFQVQVFFFEKMVLWSQQDDPPSGPSIERPFAFRLPSMDEQRAKDAVLPPSFEAGFRPPINRKGKGTIEGNQIGSTLYLIKIEARRELDGTKGVRTQLLLPVTYYPPQTSTPDLIPPPIFPPPATSEGSLPIQPPPRPRDEDGWRTIKRVQHIKSEGMFHKAGAFEVTLRLPSTRSYPIGQPVPFYLDLVALSSPLPPDSPPSQLKMPSLSSVDFNLERIVLAHAQGLSQTSLQSGGLKVVDLGAESRVWHGEMAYREEDEDGVMVGRWGRGLSVVGEMRFEGPGVGPSFLKGEKDLLGASWVLSLHIPFKGVGADVQMDCFCNINLSSSVVSDETTEGNWEGGTMEFPPSYTGRPAAGHDVPAGAPEWVNEKERRD